ncbi:bacteriophage abortive infection AbiH family protein [Collimonas fungivorans]|uniref:Bacteriophage abortive infection AbiH family protein n=2 Tax=Collimonas fungivorans TaxID=158899 RepID=A0A127P8J5_9BURK|nr:bacteriophage abortive infection AbiH family protein [Collimonas fungivorans]
MALGEADVDSMIDDCSQFLSSYGADDWSDSGHHDFQYEIEKIAGDLSGNLRTQFANWIRKITIPDAASAPNRLSSLDKNGLYLTFNYTSTLASVYSIPAANILHIHGEGANKDAELVLGHAWGPGTKKSLNDHPDIEDQDTRVTEAYGIVDDFFSATFKPSTKIILENQAFFAKSGKIKKIFVLGHSLSVVDLPYLQAIVKATDVSTTHWTVACRNEKEKPKKQAAIEALGVPEHLIATVSWDVLYK